LGPVFAATYEERFEAGVKARRDGRPADATTIFLEMQAEDPGNADVLVQLGFSQLGSNDLNGAAQSFERALAIAPEYRDANLGLAQIAVRRGDLDVAEQQANLVLASRTDEEAQTVLTQVAAARTDGPAEGELTAYRWHVDLDGIYSDLTGPSEDWREGSARVGYDLSPETRISAAVEASERFGLFDTYLEGRIDHRFSERVSAYAFLAGTPEAEFRPELAYGGGLEATLLKGDGILSASALGVDAYDRHYRDARVVGISPGFVQYFFDGRAWLTARWINVFAEGLPHDDGFSLRGDLQATDAVRLFAGISDAPDPENGLTIRTRSTFAGATVNLNDQVTIRGAYSHEDRRIGYDRDVFSAGVGLRF
jgi:YaiO family outer membrane protein